MAPSGEGSLRIQHQFKIDPNKVRALPAGAAYVISDGHAMRAQILQAPHAHGQLPKPAAGQPGESVAASRGAAPAAAPDPSGAVGGRRETEILDSLRF